MAVRWPKLLARALDEARRALDDLDSDQVPAALRDVVKASGALTPPLADRLVRELDSLEWLREKTLEKWDDAATALDGDGPDRLSALFLLRPEGWGVDLARAAWDAGVHGSGRGKESAAREAARSREERDAARSSARSLQREVNRLERDLREAQRAHQAPVDRERKELERLKREHDRERAALEREVADAVAALQSARADLDRLREELARARDHRAKAVARADEARPAPAWVGDSPMSLARALDDLVSAAGSHPDEAAADERGFFELILPPGVRPDSAQSIAAAGAMPVAKHFVVDGYNAGLALADGDAAAVRSRLEPVLGRLRATARPPCAVTVIYDSAIGESSVQGPEGVNVRFAPASVPADDVIVELAGPGVIVVSNDRELRERAHARGALALWSDALVAWARERR